jgi:hypothetical protein
MSYQNMQIFRENMKSKKDKKKKKKKRKQKKNKKKKKRSLCKHMYINYISNFGKET